MPAIPLQLLRQAGTLNSPPAAEPVTQHATRNTNQFALRLSNTSAPIDQLQRNDQAILLENALLDTTQPVPSIPDHLRAQGDPGSYLVQSRGPINDTFRSLLQAAGATIVSYIPNNAYLVRASAAVAQQLKAAPQTQAVLTYEPYYKLKLSLLKQAVAQDPLPDNTVLNVLLFADARDTTRAELQQLGARFLGDEEHSPFGPVLTVVPPAGGLPAIAGLPGVQEIEWALSRASANDLSRVRIGVSSDTLGTTTNYLGLTGRNVLVNINDSGVDATHLDLSPRVFGPTASDLVDTNGHGTHVAGIIASSGAHSPTAASGSVSNANFRGKAPAASLFSLPVEMFTRPFTDGGTLSWPSDGYLQQTAAQTNAFISNNSWNYVGTDSRGYDLHAASYDAAVRDALPTVSGSRPLLYVFSAGNDGRGDSDGTAGRPDTILSPGTAKNVITVGAIEQPRNITNQVVKCTTANSTNSCTTNRPWLSLTDSSDQVAAFSSRGPVGVGVEGASGRFKPDLVAPGTFVVSTRSQQWDTNAYYNSTGNIVVIYRSVSIPANALFLDSIFVPNNAVQLNVTVRPNTNSPVPFPALPIYVNSAGFPTNTDPVIGNNQVSLPPDLALNPVGVYWYYGIGNPTAQPVVCDLVTDIVVANELGDYLQVLAGLNDSLGQNYRYESGTSMAAADVSGTLALMQEFFEQRLRTNSPALMKALLINGARSVGNLYDFQTTAAVNAQGWGLVNLTNTLPGSLTNLNATANSMLMVDQNPAGALATGQSRTYKVALSAAAVNQPLRVTLVWTDPPGNPVASVKLVNDLDLVVTNLNNPNLVYFGNDIASGNDFNQASDTNTAPNLDRVNNVENVFLSPALGVGSKLGTNYSITVVGRRVNVNAVTAQTNNVSQDYALVISSGDGLVANALTLDASAPIVYNTQPLVSGVTNNFANSPGFSGGILFNQRVGANPQLLGTNTLPIPSGANGLITLGVTNQWRFYLITNDTSYTNAAFLTFLPADLAVTRMGVFQPSADRATRPEADIDLYVAPPSIPNNYALTNLDPAVVAAADKSLRRGGTETIVYTNAANGIYCIGVKSEDQQAAEYAFLGVFSEQPFGMSDSSGVHLVGIPLMQPIPDGSPEMPGVAIIVAPNVADMMVRRVIVTNIINHELISDLLGNLSHDGVSAVLNNHTCVTVPATAACQTWTSYIYDDSSEHNVGPSPFLINPSVLHSDGPGSLSDFAGMSGQGQWSLTMVDNATNHIGTNISLQIFLERQQDLTGDGITVVIEGNSCRDDFIEVPPNATSLTIDVAVRSATGPVGFSVDLCPLNGGTCKSIVVTNALGGSVTIDQTDLPPLQAGTYRVRTCNLTSAPFTVNIRATFLYSLNTILPVLSIHTDTPLPILDDAVTHIYLTNNVHSLLSTLDVGLLIQDPRISDLAITLISPHGTRALLFENRGAASTKGLGTFNLTTNFLMEPFYANNFDLAPVGLYAPGAAFQGWNVVSNFVEVMDDFTCLCLSNHILALLDGAVTNSLPTTNSLPPTNSNPYALSFRVNHLPWLEGMVTWWPLDFDGSDIFGGFNGLLLGDVSFSAGKVSQAYFGDGVATRMVVPRCPELDLGLGRGFSIEGWIYPRPLVVPGPLVMSDGFENATPGLNIPAGSVVSGWQVATGSIDLLSASAPGAFGVPDSGSNCIDINGIGPGTISSNVWLLGGHTYRLSFAYARNPDSVQAGIVPQAAISVASLSLVTVAPNASNSWNDVQWQHTSVVFTASASFSKLQVRSLTTGGDGVLFDTFNVTELVSQTSPTSPLAEWYDPAPPTNQSGLGVQFWQALTNGPGSLGAAIWDANSLLHVITTPPQVITNSGWQHVALTYDTNSGVAALYVNGLTNSQPLVATNLGHFVPRTSGDLYLGYHPGKGMAAGIYSVPGTANIFSAGRTAPVAPGGLGAGTLPAQVPISPNQTSFHFQSVGALVAPYPETLCGPEGIEVSPSNIAAYSGISGFLGGHIFPLLGVFLTDAVPADPSPATLDFRPGGIGRNFLSLSPAIGQVFYIGDGLTDSGQVQTFNAPPGATRLFLGFADANGFTGAPGAYGDNGGSLSIEVATGDPTISYYGGLDEFSVYERALSPCEVNAIFNAGSRGKYGTNVLVCPVATEVTLLTASGNQTYTFVNGLNWTNKGPHWETNTILFSTSTNLTPIIVRGLNPYDPANPNAPNNLNAVVDDFVLSELVPHSIDGLLHFNENTNLATIPIKFAPAPFETTNFPPVLIFSNDFQNATAGAYQVGASIPGGTNSPFIGFRNWTVTNGPVTVVRNPFSNVVATNWMAMATGAVQCLLPTSPGHRYQLNYNLRGPCAVGWWDGSVDPLSQRAQDLISGNNGAFLSGAASTTAAAFGDTNGTYVGLNGFFFNGQTEPSPAGDPDIWPGDIDDPSSKVELGDPPQLRFTNSFTIEGWINPAPLTNATYCGREQIFFRGYPELFDCRGLGNPYWLALEASANSSTNSSTNLSGLDIHFHIADAHTGTLGADVLTSNGPIQFSAGTNFNGGTNFTAGTNNTWWHIAAVFDKPFTGGTVVSNATNIVTLTTNSMRLYLNGVCIASNSTTLAPFQDLDPALSPGVTIGNRCRYDSTQPFAGFMDELTVYARALTDLEIAAIAAAGTAGKADPSVPPTQSLAKLSVAVDGVQLGVGYGDNSQWSTHAVEFTALGTNAVVTLQSLLPGTLLEGITLTEMPSELHYLPEVPLSGLYGEDVFGVWTLEIWDNRAGPVTTTNSAQLVAWQLNFGLAPVNPPPVIHLAHGIPYTNSLPAYGVQYFVVQVPQWAALATNILEFANQVNTANPLPVTVLFNQTNLPTPADFPLIGPLVSAGSATLSTNTTPPLVPGQTYYLAVTNPNPVGVTFALGVWFDITTLNNCQMLASNVVWAAGIPRYFQFDVPPSGTTTPQSVSFWLPDAPCNLTVVLSEHLPLPDLNHFDYISQQPCTNDQIVMLVTNTTPFPIQANRWYVGVFNTGATNVAFSVQACSAPAYPVIIPLTNGVPFVVSSAISPFAAPPGPPQLFFFDFLISNSVPGVLFELYNLSGDADLVLQREVPPTMAPYFDTSFFTGTAPEQIVVRTSPELPASSHVSDLRGHWYLGVYNNEPGNVAYTIRAVLPNTNGLLPSAQPLKMALTPLNPPHGLMLSWNSVEGEHYIVQYTASLAAPVVWINLAAITATTPLTTFEVLPVPSGPAFYRVIQVLSSQPTLSIQLWPANQVRISWSTAYPGYTLQSKLGLSGAWANAGLPVTVAGNDFVAFDIIGPGPKYYRLFK